jgi:outer membrane protein assembly factor BamB
MSIVWFKRIAQLLKIKVITLVICLLTSSCYSSNSTPSSEQGYGQRQTGNHISGFFLSKQNLYFGAGHCLYRLNVQDQDLHQLNCRADRLFHRPVSDGSYIYIPLEIPQVVALDAQTGDILWEFEQSSGGEGGFFQIGLKDHTALIDSSLYTVGRTWLYALEAKTGETIWKKENNYFNAYTPFLIHSNLLWYPVLAGEDKGSLIAASPDTGEEVERIKVSLDFDQLLAVDDKRVYGLGHKLDFIFAVDRYRLSEIAWQQEFSLYDVDQIMVLGNLLVLGNMQAGEVYAFNAETGEQVWAFQTPSTTTETLGGSIQDILIFTLKDTLYALDANSGKAIWQYSLKPYPDQGRRRPSPYRNQNIIYIGNRDTVDALDLETGKLLWKVEVDSDYIWYTDS